MSEAKLLIGKDELYSFQNRLASAEKLIGECDRVIQSELELYKDDLPDKCQAAIELEQLLATLREWRGKPVTGSDTIV